MSVTGIASYSAAVIPHNNGGRPGMFLAARLFFPAMKTLLAKLAVHKAVGLYLGEREVAVSQVAATFFGPVETAAAVVPCTVNNWADVADELLRPFIKRNRRLSVSIGLPNSRLFFHSRFVANRATPTPESILQQALASPNIGVEDLTVDLLQTNLDKASIASLAVCRKKYMSVLMMTLEAMRIRPLRAEPCPCALVRAAATQHPFPRRAKMLLCIFLQDDLGLATLVCDGLPLAWKDFSLPAGGEGAAIISAARTLRIQQRLHGIELAPTYAIIYGRPDLEERLVAEEFPSQMETRVLWKAGPVLGPASIAYGLALGGLSQDAKAFDLSRLLKPRPSIWEIFPWSELAFTTALVGCAGLFLGAHAAKLDDSYARATAEASRYKCLGSVEPSKLDPEAKALGKKIDAVRTFCQTRILWSNYTADLAARLPEGATIENIEARNALQVDRKGGGGKQHFAVRARAPLADDGSTPRNIDAFLTALRNDPIIQRDFSSAELTGIKQSASLNNSERSAAFGIVCKPKNGDKKK